MLLAYGASADFERGTARLAVACDDDAEHDRELIARVGRTTTSTITHYPVGVRSPLGRGHRCPEAGRIATHLTAKEH